MSTRSSGSTTRVPVDQRLLGLDRRTFAPAVFVIVVFLVLTVVVPRVDRVMSWDDQVMPGEELALTEAISFAPSAGWDVETGYRINEERRSGEVKLSNGGVTLDIMPDDFAGTPSQLLEQVEKVTSRTTDPTFRVDGEQNTLTTAAGDSGVVQSYHSLNGDGLIAALVIGDTGLEITAYGTPAEMTAAANDLQMMIASIRSNEGSGQ